PGPWSLLEMQTVDRSGVPSTANVSLRHSDGRTVDYQGSGDGPVDATYKALAQATGVSVTVHKFEVHAVTVGEDAQGEAVIYVQHDGRSYRGSSVSTNIIEASAQALLEVINRIEQSRNSAARQQALRRSEAAQSAAPTAG
ncbi:MAG TPA: alpha-isopropylmalate synthase regulatory domain-containing protein, partial [Steroidobacteraceae bacterium]|nr:alpha-isopropylmalate synthase regulatory domain-containing protein [Steroidobacteraceae bacterium]